MLDCGITFGYAQLVADNELIDMMRWALKGINLSEESFVTELIHEIGPGGNFLDASHTIKRMRGASAMPVLINREPQAVYNANGKNNMMKNATEKCKMILETHKAVPIPDKAAEEIERLLREREQELGIHS